MIRDWELEVDCRIRPRRPAPASPKLLRDRLGWLEAPVAWHAGRVSWQWQGRHFFPGQEAFSSACHLLQRAENLPPRDRRLNRAELRKWRDRLDQASRWASLREISLRHLGSPHRWHDEAVQQVLDFLDLELHLAGDLAPAASWTLFQAWPHSKPLLRRVLTDSRTSPQQRALIAMLLAARRAENFHPSDELSFKAIQFAHRYGFSQDAALAVRLLRQRSVSDVGDLLTSLPPHAGRGQSKVFINVEGEIIEIIDLINYRKAMPKLSVELRFIWTHYHESIKGAVEQIEWLWHCFQDWQVNELGRHAAELIRAGHADQARLLREILEQIFSAVPEKLACIRLDRKSKHHAFHLNHWQTEFQARTRELWQLLHELLQGRDPEAGLMLLRDMAAQFNEDLEDRHERQIFPNAWAHDWDRLLRRRLDEFGCVVRIGQQTGWELTREMYNSRLFSYSWGALRTDLHRDWYLTALKLAHWAGPDASYDVANTWMKGADNCSCPQIAIRRLQPLLDAMSGLPREERGDWLDPLLESLYSYAWNGKTSLHHLIPLFRYMRVHLKDSHYSRIESAWQARFLLPVATRTPSPAQERRLGELFAFINTREEKLLADCRWFLLKAIPLVSGLSRVELNWPPKIWERLWRQLKDLEVNDEIFLRAGEILLRYPQALLALQQNLLRQPARTLKLVLSLGQSPHLSPEMARGLALLTASRWQPVPSQSPWQALLHWSPQLQRAIQLYRSLKLALDEPDVLPSRVRHWLEWPQKIERELQWLRAANREDLQRRITSLEARLTDATAWQATAIQEIREALESATSELSLRLLEQAIDDGFRARLRAIAGPLPAGLTLDAALRNAAGLSLEVPSNRKWLRRLLRSHFQGETSWREHIPANTQFLQDLESRGTAREIWLAPHPVHFRLPFGQPVTLELCPDPLEILQMGNYFQTCLSAGEANAFSTIANTVDLNKRVIYARDARGRVIGRQLIAINDDWELVGFRVYRGLDHKDSEILRGYFTSYVADFAAACGLKLGHDGTVPLLCAEDWYNDGITIWPELSSPGVAAATTKLENSNC